MPTFNLVFYTTGIVFWFGTCGLALWRGGWPERLAAAGVLASSLVAPLVAQTIEVNTIDVGYFLTDIALFAILIFIALKSDRWWPLFAAGFDLLAVSTHFALVLSSDILNFTYLSANTLWGYAVVAALGLGILEVEARRKRQARLVAVAAFPDP